MWFGWVDGLTFLPRLTVRNAKTFAVLLSNASHVAATDLKAWWDCESTTCGWGFNGRNQDGLHFWGPVSNVTVDGLTHNGDDDGFALNTNEVDVNASTDPPLDARRGTPAGLSNITAQNLHFYGSQGVRLWGYGTATATMNNIVLRDLEGNLFGESLRCGGIGTPPLAITNLSISGWHLTGTYANLNVCYTTGLDLSDVLTGTTVALTSVTGLKGSYFGINGGGGSVTDLGTAFTLTGRHHLFSADNTWDIGASGATRPRTGYFGTSVITPLLSATTILQNGSATNAAITANGFVSTAAWGVRWVPSANATDTTFDTALGRSAKGVIEAFNGSTALYDPAHYWGGFKGGTFAAQALANPVIASVTPSANNGVTCSYTLTAFLADGVTATAPSATVSTVAGPTNCNSNTIAWTHVTGTSFYQLARTVGGATQGLITAMAAWAYTPARCPAGACSYVDTGTAASGSAPTVNSTGAVTGNIIVSATSCTGLPAGSLYNDTGTLKICP
jgi:hypothetical protein